MNNRNILYALPALLLAALCLSPRMVPAVALGLGILLGLLPWKRLWKGPAGADRLLLQGSVVVMGFGMDVHAILRAGVHGMGLSAVLLSATFLVGWGFARWMGVERQASVLVSAGTAICGGSAIAAVAASTRAERESVGLAMGVVFLLNAVALVLFPAIGHLLGMGPGAFGTWAGLAIHDVSSVVGAAATFDPRSLPVAVAVKLGRTLWILPVTLIAAWSVPKGKHPGTAKIAFPLFLLGFLAAAAATTLVPGIRPIVPGMRIVAHAGFDLALFLIGTRFDLNRIRHHGGKLLVQGFAQWIVVAVSSLAWIRFGGG